MKTRLAVYFGSLFSLRPTRQTVAALVLLVLVLFGQVAPLNAAGGLAHVVYSVTQEQSYPAPTTAEEFSAEVATAWFDLSLDLVRQTPGFTPPVAARAFGYMGVTLYETVRPGIPGAESLAGQLNGLAYVPQSRGWARYHWPSAANAALAAITRQLFPTATAENLAAIAALEAEFATAYQAEVDAQVYLRSVAWGQAMAASIFAWSMDDGGHEGYARNFPSDYIAPVGAGLWQPTPPNFSAPLQPFWGDNRPFVLTGGDACPSAPPLAYSSEVDSAFYAEALEVYEVVKAHIPAYDTIARYWADDPGRTATPAGHWISILNQVLAQEEATLARAGESYAKLGIAVADAFITCWHTKYTHTLVRPITYIQQVIDLTWNTPEITDPVITPPFPEYPSGHSVQSGAAAVVLTELFGHGYAFVDHTHDALGMEPRSYASFTVAANEAALSRLYGGIHYRKAIENGLRQGHCVAERVLELRFTR